MVLHRTIITGIEDDDETVSLCSTLYLDHPNDSFHDEFLARKVVLKGMGLEDAGYVITNECLKVSSGLLGHGVYLMCSRKNAKSVVHFGAKMKAKVVVEGYH